MAWTTMRTSSKPHPCSRCSAWRLAGAEPPSLHDLLRVQRHHSGLGGDDHEPVRRHLVAKWPQPVAVEGGTGDDAVGEDEGRGAVPGLEAGRLVAVEVAHGG